MVRTPNKNSIQYAPNPVPTEGLQQYLESELQKIATAIQLLAEGHIDKVDIAPAKPRDGDIRYASGVGWNPGGGAGIYFFNGTVWTKL